MKCKKKPGLHVYGGVWGEEKKNRGMKEWEGQMKRDRETKRKVRIMERAGNRGLKGFNLKLKLGVWIVREKDKR